MANSSIAEVVYFQSAVLVVSCLNLPDRQKSNKLCSRCDYHTFRKKSLVEIE